MMDNCWLFAGYLNKQGYGVLSLWVDGRVKTVKAHRLVYESEVGVIAPDKEVDHLCRVRACINPNHLEPVTHRENCQRGIGSKTYCAKGHEFTPENTYRYVSRTAQRGCRRCNRSNSRAYRLRKKISVI